ncbi:hypothetical protein [Nonomuraea recticatena]|uniref:hypothetical protein n=1 Tax=Nonomuraea recticatena TaxID=46178 RepID=UPI0031F7E62C
MITSEPIRAAASVAFRRATAMSTFAPSGFDQSMGTLSLPHSAAGSSSQGVQVMVCVVMTSVSAPAVETGKTVAIARRAANQEALFRTMLHSPVDLLLERATVADHHISEGRNRKEWRHFP